MKYDRRGQVWQISDADDMDSLFGDGGLVDLFKSPKWKTFTIIETSSKSYETMSGVMQKYVVHRVIVSETGIVINLNEDIKIPWEESSDLYRRVA